MGILYVDLDNIRCPQCKATAPNMLFPHPLGYLFYCGSCNHEERLLRDENGLWHWFVSRLESTIKAALAEGAA